MAGRKPNYSKRKNTGIHGFPSSKNNLNQYSFLQQNPISSFLQLNDYLFQYFLELLKDEDLMRLSQCNLQLRNAIQTFAKKHNRLHIFSGGLKVASFKQINFPKERLDLWGPLPIPADNLPQSLLHGRSAALLALTRSRVPGSINASRNNHISSEVLGDSSQSQRRGEEISSSLLPSYTQNLWNESSIEITTEGATFDLPHLEIFLPFSHNLVIENYPPYYTVSTNSYPAAHSESQNPIIFNNYYLRDSTNPQDIRNADSISQSLSPSTPENSFYDDFENNPINTIYNNQHENTYPENHTYSNASNSQLSHPSYFHSDSNFNYNYSETNFSYTSSSSNFSSSITNKVFQSLPPFASDLLNSPHKVDSKDLKKIFSELASQFACDKKTTSPLVKNFINEEGEEVIAKFGCYDDSIGSSDHLWVCGGFGLFELWDTNVPTHCNEVWEYSPRLDTWTHPYMMTHSELEYPLHKRWEDRDGFVLEKDDNSCLILFGELNSLLNEHTFDKIYFSLLPKNKHKNMLATIPFSHDHFLNNQQKFYCLPCLQDIPISRQYFSSVMWCPPGKNTDCWILLFGGLTNNKRLLNDLHLLSIPNWFLKHNFFFPFKPATWITLFNNTTYPPFNISEDKSTNTFPSNRFGHSMTKVGNRVFLFGGKSEVIRNSRTARKWFSAVNASGLLQDTWILSYNGPTPRKRIFPNPTDWNWSEARCSGCVPTPRMSHRTVNVGLHLLLFGGFTGRYVNDMYTLNTGSLIWTKVDMSPIISTLTSYTYINEPTSSNQTCNLDTNYTLQSSQGSDSSRTREYTNGYNELSYSQLANSKKYKFSSDHFTRQRLPITSNLRKKQCLSRYYFSPQPGTSKLRSLSYDSHIEPTDTSGSQPYVEFLSYSHQLNSEDGIESELYVDLSQVEASSTAYTTREKTISLNKTSTSSPHTPLTNSSRQSKETYNKLPSPSSSSHASSPKNSIKTKSLTHHPISGRMEASLLYDGDSHIYIFGGSRRYSWNCKLKFDDFCKDCFVLKLST